MDKTRNGLSWREAALLAGEKSKKARLKRISKYNEDPILCSFCESHLSYDKRKNKFCGHSCAASFNNLGITRNSNTGEWKKKKCLNCEKITKNRKCCNNKCYSEYVKKQRRNKIEQLGSLIYYRIDIWYLIENRGRRCEICYNHQWNKKDIPLDIHHKDGDSDNNKLDNLLLICPNCHRQTDNHGSKNKTDSKRKRYRKHRYDQGLSY